MSNNTEKKEKNPAEFILTNVRLSFPHLATPKAVGKDGKPRYTASFLLDKAKPEHEALIKGMRAKANELYAAGVKKEGAKPASHLNALKKGNDEDGAPLYDGYDGMWVLSAARAEKQGPPKCITGTKVLIPREEIDQILYAGCFVNAKIRLYFMDYDGSKRICASIEVVQFKAKGEPFGNGSASTEDMPDEEDTLDDDEEEDDNDDL